MRKLLYLIVALVALLTSCQHKELCYHHPHTARVRVMFDFKDVDRMPQGMRVAFYPADGGEAEIYDFVKGESRVIEIPENCYNAVCYNFDTHDIYFVAERHFTTFAATSFPASNYKDASMMHAPDWLCGQSLFDVDITNLQPGEERIILFTPRPMVCDYTYEVNGLRGLERVVDLKASLSGVAASVMMGYDTVPDNDVATLLFDGLIKDNQITGAFHTFAPLLKESHNFTLYVKTAKGGFSIVAGEVTEQILAVPLKGHIHRVHLIINLDCEIPEEPPEEGDNGAGFDPGVDDWQEINKDIFV